MTKIKEQGCMIGYGFIMPVRYKNVIQHTVGYKYSRAYKEYTESRESGVDTVKHLREFVKSVGVAPFNLLEHLEMFNEDNPNRVAAKVAKVISRRAGCMQGIRSEMFTSELTTLLAAGQPEVTQYPIIIEMDRIPSVDTGSLSMCVSNWVKETPPYDIYETMMLVYGVPPILPKGQN